TPGISSAAFLHTPGPTTSRHRRRLCSGWHPAPAPVLADTSSTACHRSPPTSTLKVLLRRIVTPPPDNPALHSHSLTRLAEKGPFWLLRLGETAVQGRAHDLPEAG